MKWTRTETQIAFFWPPGKEAERSPHRNGDVTRRGCLSCAKFLSIAILSASRPTKTPPRLIKTNWIRQHPHRTRPRPRPNSLCGALHPFRTWTIAILWKHRTIAINLQVTGAKSLLISNTQHPQNMLPTRLTNYRHQFEATCRIDGRTEGTQGPLREWGRKEAVLWETDWECDNNNLLLVPWWLIVQWIAGGRMRGWDGAVLRRKKPANNKRSEAMFYW